MALNQYPLIESVLAGIFSVNVGYSEAEADEALRRDLEHLPFRDGFMQELRRAFVDPRVSWIELLDAYDVFAFESEDAAVAYARQHLWHPTFGDSTPP